MSEKLVEATIKVLKEGNVRETLALGRGKTYRTPKGGRLSITVLTYEVNTNTKQGDIYICGYVTPKNEAPDFINGKSYKCHSAEEFCEIYLNN